MPAPAPGLQSISDLTTTSHITTGDIPPPMVGATMTIVDNRLFLFGGRLIQTRQMTNSLYILNLEDFHWQNVSETVNVAPTRAIGDPGAEDENEQGHPPTERYFHTANPYKNTIVFFGGMGPSGKILEGQQQEQIVFDDIHILDLELLQWRHVRIPSSQHAPKPRYAHLSSITGNKLIIIGGQDIQNQYIEELNVLDLDSLQWTASMPFEKHCGSYRSIAVSPNGQGTSIPIIGSEVNDSNSVSNLSLAATGVSDGFPTSYLRKASSSTSLHYTPSLRKSSSNMTISRKGGPASRLSVGSSATLGLSSPSSLEQRSSINRLSHLMSSAPAKEEHPIYVYSNFNFSDVKRELQVLTPPIFHVQDHSQSMSGNLLPPGLRFPTGAIAGQHLVLSGTYLSQAQQSFSIWSLNLASLVWTRIDTGTVFSTGSWNRGIMLENTNTYLVFGNKDRNLADDYQNRQTNFEHVSVVDLEAFGIYQHPPTTMTQTAQELGLSLLNDPSMADFDILTQDQQRIPINSAVLATRWPYFATLLREQEERDVEQCKANNSEYDPTLSPKRTLSLPEPYPVVLAFLQYLYTDHLVTAQQHHPQVLSQLLLLADMYGLDRLRDLATHALHQMLNMSTAAMVYETAALSQQTGLQIRSLKVMIAAKKMLQQQQMKLQHQQALNHSTHSPGNSWATTTEILHQQQQQQQQQQQYSSTIINGGHDGVSPQYGNSNYGSNPSPYLQQQQEIHAHFQPISRPPLSPGSINGPPSPDYNRVSFQSSALPHPTNRSRGSALGSSSGPNRSSSGGLGTMSSSRWNTEPLTPPPATPLPSAAAAAVAAAAAAVPQTPPATKTSFFSFPGYKNKQASQAVNIPSSETSTWTSSKKGGSTTMSTTTGASDGASVKSNRSTVSTGSDPDKKKTDDAMMQKLLDSSFGMAVGGPGGVGMMSFR
ncbi:hypothetical protein BX616_003855 [Lobosporangium transversale]|uniref:BTB domain-containing protein n=1 Tax=Lobosporangium transversale TaxID=64571 RepID=A0A1Y2GJW6_9FUNG|nr:hypothetical protein BCR41DRAFT_397455 [Lobosporangium transversale]KAF9898576.1 hypothetical protein BX616_003855 [Lobosporangium transversale]ORZ13030.1 hypothetical protein BCR41DRAFT_397455 [Lobosporangium transversale]|eukprot:XP_021880379.1 hypothetical protein BCR41DRAFT_397455 [Lobosporangium transversale]